MLQAIGCCRYMLASASRSTFVKHFLQFAGHTKWSSNRIQCGRWSSKFPSSHHKVNLWGAFVYPGYRGREIGRTLVERAFAHAHANGVGRVNLTAYVPNEPAV